MSRKQGETFTMLGPGLGGHVARRGFLDRWRRVPDQMVGEVPPVQRRLEAQTVSGLARRGSDFYREVAMVHEPDIARAQTMLSDTQRRLDVARVAEVEATTAVSGVMPSGGASDASRQLHRRARLARTEREQAEAAVTVAASALAEVTARRDAAAAAAQHRGLEHLALGRAAVHGYWEWLLRSRRGHVLTLEEAPSGLAPMAWMISAEADADAVEEGG